MACKFRDDFPCQLGFTFPENGYKKNFKLILSPDQGEQRSIITCKWSESYQCDTEDGYGIEFPSDNQALITLPEGFNEEPGSFKCQFAGQEVISPDGCSWKVKGNPKDDIIFEHQGGLNVTQSPHDPPLPRSEDIGNGDANLGIVIGTVIGAVVIIILIIVLILLSRKYKNKKRPHCPEKPNMNKSPVPGSEKDEKICILGHVNTMMVDNEKFFSKNISRNETDGTEIDEKKPFLGNEDDSFIKKKKSQKHESNEKNDCKMGSEKKSSDKESDNTYNDKGFEEKGSDKEKSSEGDTDKRR